MRSLRLGSVVLAIFVAACNFGPGDGNAGDHDDDVLPIDAGANPVDASPDARIIDAPTPPPIDGGGGIPGFDGGIPGWDGGLPSFDGGIPGFDGGLPSFDGGIPGWDGGLPSFDGGIPGWDGGFPF
jgi:hypothetical protein